VTTLTHRSDAGAAGDRRVLYLVPGVALGIVEVAAELIMGPAQTPVWADILMAAAC
jgi:hypothetical protein